MHTEFFKQPFRKLGKRREHKIEMNLMGIGGKWLRVVSNGKLSD
jgi:hypothetical protein